MTGPSAPRAPDGVLLLDKPAGMSSSAALRRVLLLVGARKGGHTGTLDPLATGLLPITLGEATKYSQLLLDAVKVYIATVQLGVTTRTGDLEGEPLDQKPVRATDGEISAALRRFEGEIEQVPPMYSALKHEGRRLYELARSGLHVERAPRRVVIHRIELLERRGDRLDLRVACSKGTYIRVLAEDIGRALGCGACLAALRREAVGGFSLAGAVTLTQLEQWPLETRRSAVLPTDALVAALPRLDLDERCAWRLTHGQAVEGWPAADVKGLARVYGPGPEFLGVAEVTESGRIVPRRLTAQAAALPGKGGRRRVREGPTAP